ncbi:MAG TPA: hypothetical protein VK445_11095 [Dissulfurispiraceae bacterium]|nr:hypothetical protein [Dissulfurispiraceae bacterium]
MNKLLLIVFIGAALFFGSGSKTTAYAVSYQPPFRLIPDSKAIVVKGGTVYLFHSGSPDIINSMRNNDILVVYRTGTKCALEEVGRVRFVAFVGATYMETEVIEGELHAGDIARKENIAGLVVALEPCTR